MDVGRSLAHDTGCIVASAAFFGYFLSTPKESNTPAFFYATLQEFFLTRQITKALTENFLTAIIFQEGLL